MVIVRCSAAGSPVLLTQERAQPSADEHVEHSEDVRMRVLEVREPASQGPIEIIDDAREAVPARAPCLFPDAVLETVQTLLANSPPAGLEPVAKEVEPSPHRPAVADLRLVGMQTQAIIRHPAADLRQGGFGLLAALAQNH